jgi:hypothetical protein
MRLFSIVHRGTVRLEDLFTVLRGFKANVGFYVRWAGFPYDTSVKGNTDVSSIDLRGT